MPINNMKEWPSKLPRRTYNLHLTIFDLECVYFTKDINKLKHAPTTSLLNKE